MIINKIIFGLLLVFLLNRRDVYGIYDPHDPEASTKSKGFHGNQEVSEPIIMHHQYSQVASNRPINRSPLGEVREARTSYTDETENYIAQHGLECPPNATGQYPYLLNCRQFLNCWKGRGYLQSCAPGTVFNPDTRECDNPQKVVCLNYRREAGSSDYSAAKLQSIDDDSQPPLAVNRIDTNPSGSVQCSPGYSGVEPHPFDCAKFLNCANGITYIQDCGPGTVFNDIHLVCDYPYNVDCSKRNARISASTTTRPSDHQEWVLPDVQSNNQQAGWQHRDQSPQSSSSQPTGRNWQNSRGVQYQGNEEKPVQEPQPESGEEQISQPAWKEPVPQQSQSQLPYDDKLTAFPNQNNRNHSNPQPGWYNPSTTNQEWQSQTPFSSSVPDNRNPKIGWNQQQTDPDEPFYPIEENSKPIPSAPSEFEVQQVQVHQAPSSGSPVVPKDKIVVHYAQPVGAHSDLDITKISRDLLPPPPPPSRQPKVNSPDSSGKNETVTVYYAQPMNDFNADDLLQRLRSPNRESEGPFAYQQPSWQRRQSEVPRNKTRIYYASPATNYNDFDENEKNWEQKPSETLTPPQRTPWSTNSREPTHTFNRNHWYPIPNPNNFQNPQSPREPSRHTTNPTVYDQLKPPPNQPPQPTVPFVPIPHGDLLPPVENTKTTNQPTNPANLPVIYPPPEPTNPLIPPVGNYPLYPPLSSVDQQNSTIFYSPSYSGVAHTKPSAAAGRQYPVEVEEEETMSKKVIPIYIRPSKPTLPSVRTTFKLPEPFNHNYYNPVEARTIEQKQGDDAPPEMATMPISEAMKMLLRPYFNRSGTVTDDTVKNVNDHIMKLTPKKKAPSKETEAELVFTGEQSNLNEGAQHHPDQNTENSDENPTEHTNHHHWYHSPHHHNHYPHQHNFHAHNHTYHHPYHHHHHHHHHPEFNHSHNHPGRGGHSWDFHNPEQHSREFHRRHPNIRNPFTNNDTETNVDIDVRSDVSPPKDPPSNEPRCEFDCKNGKCVNENQVCDGVNNCGNRFDEKNCDHLGYEVRLSSDEGKPNMGRVEVKVNGKWGYVCDDKFGLRAADILCRELGFELGASEVRANSYYAPNKEMYDGARVRYLMDEVDCLGNETSIRECNFKGWGIHDCSPEELVGVVCKVPVMTCPANYWLCKTSQECVAVGFLCDSVVDCQDGSDEDEKLCNGSIQYRLQGGTEMEGRVEVKYRDTWGTVCDDDFGRREAQVLCRTLGYLGDATVLKNQYGSGTGAIWLDQVSCAGNETKLEDCSHWAWGEHNCNHSEDVSVRCSDRKINPLAEPTTTPSPFPEKIPEDDIDMYLYKMQRSSKSLNQNKRCGQINEHAVDEFSAAEDEFARVVNGTKAVRGHHPWQASLRAKGRNGMSSHWCGAILITQMHVLTAAHCLVGYQKGALFVRLGDHYSKIAEPSEVDSFIQNWYTHEDFRKGHHMNNDIALIVLKAPIIFNDYIQPVCLPPKDAKYEAGMKCTISGWGSIKSGISTPSNNLKAAHVPIISQDVCKEPYVYGKAITDGMFCAGYLDEGVDACDGDSGGPLACSTPNGETLYGIISWGQHCGQANKPGVYVKVAHYLDWIMEKIMFSIKAKDQ